ncbi:MAG: exodeoxyribonuclease VII large subunit [Wenzhouxiangella sp.]|jgi:exodeoxyribonuclease VII large subunit|nr:exodeoxyribonuclease VII large subunit [Wenzhouxiangella sp.]
MSVSAPGPETAVLSPSEINREVKIHLEAGFPRVWLRGEISNLACPASGHLYFSLKDSRAQIRCALFRGNTAGLDFRPANGDEVLVRGRLSLYEPRGDYQLIADGLLSAGAGALQQAFDALKRKLEQEGLFAPEKKLAIPAWPKRLAVVTSPSGAAIRDILNVLAQRWPLAEVKIYATAVQGEAAAPQLRRALLAAESDGFAEVILLARGGGSIEDLWAFNDESLARTISTLGIPVISGVGHETDFTISDFVADLRAPTPTAAAVAATPDGPAIQGELTVKSRRMVNHLVRKLDTLAQSLDYVDRRLQARHPIRRIGDLSARQNQAHRRLAQIMARSLESRRKVLSSCQQRLLANSPRRKIRTGEHGLETLEARLGIAIKTHLDRSEARWTQLARILHAASPLNVLDRGYAVVMDTSGNALTQARHFQPDQALMLRFKNFEVPAKVTGTAQPVEPELPDEPSGKKSSRP